MRGANRSSRFAGARTGRFCEASAGAIRSTSSSRSDVSGASRLETGSASRCLSSRFSLTPYASRPPVGVFAGTYVSAGIILLASLLVGRAVMLALGRREASFLEGAVGLAVLILICTVAIRLPGDAATSLACSAIVVVVSFAFLFVRREAILGPSVGIALPVALVAGLLASLPFIASGHLGIPGVGLNNDMAMHLVDTDYLLDPHGPQPQSIVNGYPIGPHSLVATVVNLLGTEPLQG